MDRSYLSDPDVVAASQNFICLRLVTFEDKHEMEFMNSIFFFETPTKNSLFAILDPSAEKHLVTPGRSMRFAFDDAGHMARRMNEIADEYPGKGQPSPSKLALPYLKDVRVALNVAACDTQCLVILYARNAGERRRLESLLLPLAWDADLVGDFLYVSTDAIDELSDIAGASVAPGLLVVKPDAYGLEGRQVAFVPLGTKADDARSALVAAANSNRLGSKDSKRHVGRGLRAGLVWEPLVVDPGPGPAPRGRRLRDDD